MPDYVSSPSAAVKSRFSLTGSTYDPAATQLGAQAQKDIEAPIPSPISHVDPAAMAQAFAPVLEAINTAAPPPGQTVPERQKPGMVFLAQALANIGSSLTHNPEFAHATMENILQTEEQRKAVIAQNYMETQAFSKEQRMQRLGMQAKIAEAQFERAIQEGDAAAAQKAQVALNKAQEGYQTLKTLTTEAGATQRTGMEQAGALTREKMGNETAIKVAEINADARAKAAAAKGQLSSKDYVTLRTRIMSANPKNLPEAQQGISSLFADLIRQTGYDPWPPGMTKDEALLNLDAQAARTADTPEAQSIGKTRFALGIRKATKLPLTGNLTDQQYAKFRQKAAEIGVTYPEQNPYGKTK